MEILTEALNANRSVIIDELRQLRQKDSISHKELLEVREEETALIAELQTLIKEGKTIDEAQMVARLQAIEQRRANIVHALEEQVSSAQHLYDQLDSQYNYLADKTKGISFLLANVEALQSAPKKKK
eukprot:gene43765-53520_t